MRPGFGWPGDSSTRPGTVEERKRLEPGIDTAAPAAVDEFTAILAEIDLLRSTLDQMRNRREQACDHEQALASLRRRAAQLFAQRIVPLFATRFEMHPVAVLKRALPVVVPALRVRIEECGNRIEVALHALDDPACDVPDSRFAEDAVCAFAKVNYPFGITIVRQAPNVIRIQTCPEPQRTS